MCLVYCGALLVGTLMEWGGGRVAIPSLEFRALCPKCPEDSGPGQTEMPTRPTCLEPSGPRVSVWGVAT